MPKGLGIREVPVELRVNGVKHVLRVKPYERLLDTLRRRLGITSVKDGCGRGECGACLVIVDGELVPSCLMLTVQARGRDVVTVEGISSRGLHPIQEALIKVNAPQCGFCIPGVVVAAYWLLEVKGNLNPSDDDVREALSTNLCRCGSYHRFVEAVKIAAEELRARKALGVRD